MGTLLKILDKLQKWGNNIKSVGLTSQVLGLTSSVLDLCHKCGTKCDRKNKGCTQIFLFNYITALLSICVEIFVGTLYYVTNTKNLELTSSSYIVLLTILLMPFKCKKGYILFNYQVVICI